MEIGRPRVIDVYLNEEENWVSKLSLPQVYVDTLRWVKHEGKRKLLPEEFEELEWYFNYLEKKLV